MELDSELLRKQVDTDPYQTTREMAVCVGVSQSTVTRGLKSIGKVRKLGRWVPHALTQYDMDRRVDVALSLLTLKRTHAWLEHLVCGDEKWILYSNVHRRAQWIDKGLDAEDVPKPNAHAKKVMLSIWWSIHGVEYWELLGEGSTVTADVYVDQLRNLKANLENARPQQHK
ncbi:transposase, partial [Ancylostoma ceylanicum]